jgi:hypothetical protein
MILTSTHCKKLMMNSMGCYSSWSLPWICCCGRCLRVHVNCHCSYCLVDFLLLFSCLQNYNYSKITVFSFTFFLFSLLFGKEFLSSGFFSLLFRFSSFPPMALPLKAPRSCGACLTVLFWGLLLATLLTCSLSGIVEPKCLQ